MSRQATRQIKTIVGDNLRAARVDRGLTQRELGVMVDMDTTTISRWERGTVMPNLGNLSALAEALQREVAWFYSDHPEVPA